MAGRKKRDDDDQAEPDPQARHYERSGEVAAAIDRSIRAATDAGRITDLDAGAVQALRVLARKIDTEDQLRDLALDAASEEGRKPPPVDNVSIPTLLKFCESLGLTPAGRKAATPTGAGPEKGAGTSGGDTVARLRGIAGGAQQGA